MKILTEKEQLRAKLDEIEKSIEYAQEVEKIAYDRKKHKEYWGIFSFILDEQWLLDFNYERKVTQLKLLCEYKETISDRLLGL